MQRNYQSYLIIYFKNINSIIKIIYIYIINYLFILLNIIIYFIINYIYIIINFLIRVYL